MDLYFLILKSSETAWKMERNLVRTRGGISNERRKDEFNVKTRDDPFGRKRFFTFRLNASFSLILGHPVREPVNIGGPGGPTQQLSRRISLALIQLPPYVPSRPTQSPVAKDLSSC